jgi:hypothetical protein
VQADNGVFRGAVLKNLLVRLGIEIGYTDPGQPVQNGAIEKAAGDVKRGIIYDVVDEARGNMRPTESNGKSGVLNAALLKAITEAVDDLNYGRRRATNPASEWANASRFDHSDKERQRRIREENFMVHQDVKVSGQTVYFDDRMAHSPIAVKDPACRCLVREYFTQGRHPVLYYQSPTGRLQRLTALQPISRQCEEPEQPIGESEYGRSDGHGALGLFAGDAEKGAKVPRNRRGRIPSERKPPPRDIETLPLLPSEKAGEYSQIEFSL